MVSKSGNLGYWRIAEEDWVIITAVRAGVLVPAVVFSTTGFWTVEFPAVTHRDVLGSSMAGVVLKYRVKLPKPGSSMARVVY